MDDDWLGNFAIGLVGLDRRALQVHSGERCRNEERGEEQGQRSPILSQVMGEK